MIQALGRSLGWQTNVQLGVVQVVAVHKSICQARHHSVGNARQADWIIVIDCSPLGQVSVGNR